jgi:hypothetical protein
VGTQKKHQIIAFFLLAFYVFTVVATVSAADNATLTISMLDGEQQTRFHQPVLVAGIWHYVNISVDQSMDELIVRFYKGTTPAMGSKNESNYYEWSYEKNSATVWNDRNGYGISYMQQDLCKNTIMMYSFCIGIKDTMPNIIEYYENWTVGVSSDGTSIYSESIVIEKPRTGVSLSKPSSIIFHVDPFTLIDAPGDNSFKIGNKGNIPVFIYFDSERYPDVEITNLNKNFLPNETTAQTVIVHSQRWPPGVKRIDIQLNASYPQSYFIDTNATVSLYPSFVIDVPQLVIYVGHSNYRIDEIQGTAITFQFLEKLTMYEGEIRDINAYVSGNGAVTVEIWADEQNISALKIYDGTTETHSPLSFTSTNTSERIIVVTVKALGEGKTGILTYRIISDGIPKSYTTQISIGPPQSQNKETTGSPVSIMQIIVAVIVLLVVVYIIVSYVRNRKK